MEALALSLPEPAPQLDFEVRRFSSDGAVVVRDRVASVYIGGTLIGGFGLDDDERGPRNILAVALAKSGQFHLGRLAAAFGITDEHLRRLRRKEENEGLSALFGPWRGKVTKVTAEMRAYAMFDAGQRPIHAHRGQPKRKRLVYSTVWRVWDDWRRERNVKPPTLVETAPATVEVEGQLALRLEPAVEVEAPAALSDSRSSRRPNLPESSCVTPASSRRS